MNFGALVLIFIGGIIMFIGVTGTGQNLCNIITNGNCSWWPSKAS